MLCFCGGNGSGSGNAKQTAIDIYFDKTITLFAIAGSVGNASKLSGFHLNLKFIYY